MESLDGKWNWKSYWKVHQLRSLLTTKSVLTKSACINEGTGFPIHGFFCSKPLGGFKVDSAFHPSEVDKMTTRDFWEQRGKKWTAPSKWLCSLEAVEPHPSKGAITFVSLKEGSYTGLSILEHNYIYPLCNIF